MTQNQENKKENREWKKYFNERMLEIVNNLHLREKKCPCCRNTYLALDLAQCADRERQKAQTRKRE